MRVEGLTPGEAYTAWLAYFDRPLACKQTPCSGADVLGKDPVGTLGRMDGIVADGTRTAELHGDLRDLRVSGGSQVALLLFGHGAARQDNGGRNHQLLMPRLPRLGLPADGASAGDTTFSLSVAHAIFILP